MSTLKSKLAAVTEGSGALFFIQAASTLEFAVLYSTLVLCATKHLHLTAKEATALMGVFGAFNCGRHLFGGYLGGRFLSNRNLFVGGMVLQMIGCGSMAVGTTALFYWGLALFLTGSGLNVTCINMMLTERFAPDDARREGAFCRPGVHHGSDALRVGPRRPHRVQSGNPGGRRGAVPAGGVVAGPRPPSVGGARHTFARRTVA